MTDGTPDFDTTRTFVQVVARRPDGFVEFRFSIGDPSLFVEMLLTEDAFQEFRDAQRAELLAPVASASPVEPDGFDWSLHDATRHPSPVTRRRFEEHPTR